MLHAYSYCLQRYSLWNRDSVSRHLNFENENEFDESPVQGSGDSLCCKDVRHKELKSLISEPQLGAE